MQTINNKVGMKIFVAGSNKPEKNNALKVKALIRESYLVIWAPLMR